MFPLPRSEGSDIHGISWPVTYGTRQQHLMYSNELPREGDLAVVHATESIIAARLIFLDREIAEVEALLRPLHRRLKQLQKERSTLQRDNKRNQAIASPVRRLPTELLGQIFVLTLPSAQEERNRACIDLSTSPWVLTHICRRWRAIALSVSSLWSHITISYQKGRKASYPLPLVAAHIARSSTGLEVILKGFHPSPSESQIEIFRFLAQHSERWIGFSLQLSPELQRVTPEMDALLGSLQGRIPKLRSLSLRALNAEKPIAAFKDAASLLDVTVLNTSSYGPLHPTLPFHQLTRYRVNATWKEHMRLVTLASGLIEARLEGPMPWPQPSQAQPILLPSLRRLFVSQPHGLDDLTLPSLEEIAFKFTHAWKFLAAFDALVQRSSCPLRRLCIQGFPNAEATVEVLEHLPSISELIILVDPNAEYIQEAHNLLRSLAACDLDGRPRVAPGLQLLGFGCEVHINLDYSLFLDAIESRWKAEQRCLESATLLWQSRDSGTPLKRAVLKALLALQQDGLDFSVAEGRDAVAVAARWVYAY